MSQVAGILEIQVMMGLSRLSDDVRRAERMVGDGMDKITSSVSKAAQAMSKLGMGLSLGILVDQLRRVTDQYTKLDAQIRLATRSQEQYNVALDDVHRISTVAQTDISATNMLYTRLLNTTRGVGVTQQQVATVTETVSYGLKAYGATAAEAASATLQLSQAMGSNRLGGEEFRAVMEAMPNVMEVLAKSMGVPLGELRNLSIAGKITTEEMVKAFGDPAIAETFREMALKARTITGAWTVARNELVLLVGEFMKASGITGTVISVFDALGFVIRQVAKAMDAIVIATMAWAAITAGTMISTYIAARAEIKATVAANMEEIAAREASVVATMASNEASIANAVAKLKEADAINAVSVAHFNATSAADLNIVSKQAERAAVIQNLSVIGKERAAIDALIYSKGAAVSNALKAERDAILERRTIAKIELGLIDASIAANQNLAGVNVASAERIAAVEVQRAAIKARLIALEEAQTIAEAELVAVQNAHTASMEKNAAASTGMFAKFGQGIMAFVSAHPVIIALTVAIIAINYAIKNSGEYANELKQNWTIIKDKIHNETVPAFKYLADSIGLTGENIKIHMLAMSMITVDSLSGMAKATVDYVIKPFAFMGEYIGIKISEIELKSALLKRVASSDNKLSLEETKALIKSYEKLTEESLIDAAKRIENNGIPEPVKAKPNAAVAWKPSDDWMSANLTKAQKEAAAINELNIAYVKELNNKELKAGSHKDRMLQLQSEYLSQLEVIKKQYTEKADSTSEYDSAIKKSNDFIKAIRRESEELGVTTEMKKNYDAELIASDMRKAGVREANITKFLDLAKQESAVLQERKAQQKYLNDELDLAIKQADDMVKAYDDKQQAAIKDTAAMQAELDKLIEQNNTYGLGEQALFNYRLEKKQLELDDARRADPASQATKELEKQIEIMRKIAKEGGRKDAIDAAKKAKEEWKKTNDEINRTLTDALMRAFESGKGFADAFKKTVMDMFKTMVLRPIISAVMSPVSVAVSGGLASMGIGTAANAIGTSSSALNSASLISKGYELLGGSMLQAGEAFNTGLAALTEAVPALAGVGEAMSGASLALSAIPGWGWAALGAASIASGLFGGGGAPKQSEFMYGDVAAMGSHNTATATTPGFYASNVSEQGDAYVDNAMAAYQRHLTATYSLQALKKANGVSFNLGPNPGIEAEINKFKSEVEPIIAAYDAALKSLSDAMTTLGKTLPIDHVDGLVKAFARAGVASDAMSTYYQNFYTETERQVTGVKRVVTDAMTALGVSMPSSIAGFRALVDAQDLSTTAGQDMFAGLIKISGAFASVEAEEKKLNDQRRAMEIKLMESTGDAAGALAAKRADELAALDATLRPIQEQINAQTDLNTAYDKASAAMKAIKLLTTDAFATLIDYTRYMTLASNAGISEATSNLPTADNVFQPNSAPSDNTNNELVTSVDELRAELKAGQIALATYMAETAKILRRWNGDGMPEVRVLT